MVQHQGVLSKMSVSLETPVAYQLLIGEEKVSANALIGKPLSLEFSGTILCKHCGRKSSKSFSQGYCYPCFKSLAQCDMCIMKPETCHFAQGTCREPDWAEQFCMQPHVVYLANSSGLKVGITREDQVPTRWIDQGAIQAIPLMRVSERRHSGLVEVCVGQVLKDKTNWRAMLKGEVELIDLVAKRDEILQQFDDEVREIGELFGDESYDYAEDDIVNIEYPVEQYPEKVKSYNLDKIPLLEDTLVGIKGQYLIFENGVVNIRKYTGYDITLSY